MTAYMVVLLRLRDPAWLADYAANVPAIVRRHGGEYLAVPMPGSIRQVEGSGPAPDAIVLFRFPSTDAAHAFVEADDYRPYKAARMAGSDSDMFIFENDDDAPQFVGQ